MITGYNTDVKHGNRVFHVQTEDKGEVSLQIESLVYVGGQIITGRKTSYAEAIRGGRDDRVIQEVMEKQHRGMIAAIQRGRFDGVEALPSAKESDEPEESGRAEPEPSSPGGRTLDQVILDYLASEMKHEQIDCLFTPVPDLVAGKTAALRIRAQSSLSREPVADASIRIRLLSTAAEPAVLFQGTTGPDGSCPVSFSVPSLAGGSAAASIRVSSPIGSTEFKFPVRRPA